jgi:hypothetical protein
MMRQPWKAKSIEIYKSIILRLSLMMNLWDNLRMGNSEIKTEEQKNPMFRRSGKWSLTRISARILQLKYTEGSRTT